MYTYIAQIVDLNKDSLMQKHRVNMTCVSGIECMFDSIMHQTNRGWNSEQVSIDIFSKNKPFQSNF